VLETADTNGSINTIRLRIGMAVLAVLHPLFWIGRSGGDSGDIEIAWTRAAIVLLALALIGVSLSRTTMRRFGQHAMLAAMAVAIGGSLWILVLRDWRMEAMIAPVTVCFVVSAVAVSRAEMVLTLGLGTVVPTLLTFAHGASVGQLPAIPLLSMASSAIGGTFVSWFRIRSSALLREEIARRKVVEADLLGARAHLESILNATSDGILGVQFAADEPRVGFANRRFGEIFGLAPHELVGVRDDDLRAVAARSFLRPENFESSVAWLYAHPEAVRVDQLELVHPMPAVLERWSGPVRNADGGVVGRIWAFRDVTAERAARRDLDEYTARLEAANTALERASQAKDLFLANLSHELRTPLSVIIGYLNLVLEGGLSATEARDFLERSNRSATHLLQLISDMLDLTRLESGTAVLEVAPLAVTPIVEEVRMLTEVLASAKSVGLEIVIDGDPWVLADAQRLKQILLNLVGNALKFTDAGSVTVTVDVRPGEVGFTVRDTGCGIPRDQQAMLFSKFMRLDSRATAPTEGVGLGLSICRELVTLMNGTISLASAGLGHGTEVRFTLPSGVTEQRRTAANP
jgi:signal transduction histidine kinase